MRSRVRSSSTSGTAVHPPTLHHTPQARRAHGSPHNAAPRWDPFQAELIPHPARAVDAAIRAPQEVDLAFQHRLTLQGASRGAEPAIRTLAAPELDGARCCACACGVSTGSFLGVDEYNHHVPRRLSSARAKYADAVRTIFLAQRRCRFSRSSGTNRACSLVVRLGRFQAPRSARQTHSHSVSSA